MSNVICFKNLDDLFLIFLKKIGSIKKKQNI